MVSWTDRILASATTGEPGLPGFPPDDVQMQYVGRAGRDAILEVLPFVDKIRSQQRIGPETLIVDFGAGWGRIARLFQEEVTPSNLVLADVAQDALDWCERLGVVGTPMLLAPTGQFNLNSASVDVVYSYSVFSHLSEAAARHWLAEIARVLRPGGALVFTAQSMRFLQAVRALHDKKNPNEIERSIGSYMGDPYAAIRQYQANQHVFSGTGGGGVLSNDFYGWAAMPRGWFEREFGKDFRIVQLMDEGGSFEQAVFVCRRS